jgi:capsular exopolysaccharide synthesis family protein
VRTLNDQIAELERALDEESRHVVSRGQRDYRAALKKEALLRKALDEQSALVRALGAGETGRSGYQALTRELLTSQEEFAVLNQKLKEVSISAALKAANVGIVDRAKPPLTPEGLPFLVVLGLSTFVGLLTAAGVMFVRDQLDTSMRTAADVQAYLGVRPIGAIPAVQGRRALGASPPPGWRRLDEGRAPQSVLSEAFATLRNTMLVQDGAGRSRVLLVTSAHSEEGKTTISINLSLSLARLGYRVLLVDGNLRYPCVRRALGLPDRLGVSEYLDRGEDWRSSLHRQVEPNLDVLGGTEPQVSPADLLSLPSMQELLDRAGREYDFVLVDSPAMLCHPADVHSLAAIVDNVLVVIRQGSTPRAAASLALSQLDRVSGVILNRSSGAHAVADTGVP